MSLLKKAVNQTAAAKIGIYGEAGSGKTRTAMEIAVGFAKLTGRPIAFFDTEGGSDFMVRIAQQHNVELLTAKARAFAALMEFVKEATELGAIGIVDSISHTWDDLRQSYEKKLKRTKGLEIWDWGVIKPQWAEFTTAYLTSPIHMIVCGRAASVYEQVWNEEKGKNEVQVVGSKMKTEKETAYEPSLLIEMERAPQRMVEESGVHVIARVVKDRSDQMDGKSFNDPTFETFQPFFNALNLGGDHKPTDATRTSESMFSTPDNAIERKRRCEIAQEKIKEAFVLADCAGTGKDEKKKQTVTLIEAFGTSSWAAIQNLRVEELEAGLEVVRQELGLDPKPGEPMTEEELQGLNELIEKAVAAGSVSGDTQGLVFQAVLTENWSEVRRYREIVLEKLAAEATTTTTAAPTADPEPQPDVQAAAESNHKPKRSRKSETVGAGA